jgi:predicted metal-binding protein
MSFFVRKCTECEREVQTSQYSGVFVCRTCREGSRQVKDNGVYVTAYPIDRKDRLFLEEGWTHHFESREAWRPYREVYGKKQAVIKLREVA